MRLRCPAPVRLSHAHRPRCVCAQTLAPLCNLEILAPMPTGRLAPRPAGATAADFEDGGAPDRSSRPRAEAWQAFAARVALCRFIACAASNLPDRTRFRWARQEIFDERLRTDEPLLQAADEWLTHAGTWFRGLSRLPPSPTTSSDDDELDDEPVDSEPVDSEDSLFYPEQ